MARAWTLTSRPQGLPTMDNFALVDLPARDLNDGEVRIGNTWLSVDPYMRGRMSQAKSYAKGVEPGDVMTGEVAGEMALITDGPRSADVVAIRDSRLAFLPLAAFDALLDCRRKLANVGPVALGQPRGEQAAAGIGLRRVELHQAGIAGRRLVKALPGKQQLGAIVDGLGVVGLQGDRALVARQRLVRLAHVVENQCQLVEDYDELRVVCQNFLQA